MGPHCVVLRPARRVTARWALPVTLCVALAGCNAPLDLDMRGAFGGFSTADAARTATAPRPQPDARGVISYPSYQVAVARRGDTVADVADRVGTDAETLARFNGIGLDVPLRDGEVIALPERVAEPAPGGVDISSLASSAIDNAPDTTPVTTSALPPASTGAAPAPPPRADQPEPVRHKVERGETVYTIARLYQVPVRALADWNGLSSDFAVREGQYLLIPVAEATPPARRTGATAATTVPGAGTVTPTPPSASRPLPAERTTPVAEAPDTPAVDPGPSTEVSASRGLFAYPVQGRIIRAYAKGRNDGIDIAADPGTPVRAAADGTVAAITQDANKVPILVLRHPDNLLTVYANVTDISAEKGARVRRGQSIAKLRDGDQAYVHFEVRNGFESVDPQPYLE